MTIKKQISSLVRRVRILSCHDQGEFGKLIGVSHSAICNYERGARVPRFRTLRKLVELGVKYNIEIGPEILDILKNISLHVDTSK